MGGGREVGNPAQPCAKRLFNARWQTTPVKCGNDAVMLSDTENIAAGMDATFTVKLTADSSSIDTETSTSAASSVEGTWVSQKPSNNWNGAEVKFTVTCDGLTAESQDPQLSFHRYADIARTDFPQHLTSGIYGWDRAVKVELNDRLLIIHAPIKIRKSGDLPKRRKNEGYAEYVARWVPSTYNPATDDLSAGEKVALKNAIEGFYQRRLAMHRTGCQRHSQAAGCPDQCARKCCKFEIQVFVHFYNMNDATAPSWAPTVNYWNGSDRANSGNWFAGDYPGSNWVFAHEVGHLLGFYDEYQPDGATGPAPWQPSNGAGLMGGGQGLETYYFNEYATWLGDAARTGEPWAVVQYS